MLTDHDPLNGHLQRGRAGAGWGWWGGSGQVGQGVGGWGA